MKKLILWLKQVKNIVFIVLLSVVGIYGIIDNNLEIIIKIFVCLFLFGLLTGGFFYLKNKIIK